MKQPKQNFLEFLRSPFGTILVIVVFFYAVTFAVYYFYSPGPEERRQAEREVQNRLMTQELQSLLSTQQTL